MSEPLRAGIEIEPGDSALANFPAKTRPRILLRACHHLGPHGIACDRAGTGPHVPVRLDRTRCISTVPQGAGPAFHAIDITGLARRSALHQLGENVRCVIGFQEEMDMISHQTKGGDLHPVLYFPCLEGFEIIGIIGLLGKDDVPVMPPLENVVRRMRQNEPGVSRHSW